MLSITYIFIEGIVVLYKSLLAKGQHKVAVNRLISAVHFHGIHFNDKLILATLSNVHVCMSEIYVHIL